MSRLDTLEEKYREAQEAFREDRTEENHKRYRKAKLAFSQARVDERREQEADSMHVRGLGTAFVNNSATGVNDEGNDL